MSDPIETVEKASEILARYPDIADPAKISRALAEAAATLRSSERADTPLSAYTSNCDPQAFIAARVRSKPNLTCSAALVYDAYVDFAAARGLLPVSLANLASRLRAAGFADAIVEPAPGKIAKGWIGMAVLDNHNDDIAEWMARARAEAKSQAKASPIPVDPDMEALRRWTDALHIAGGRVSFALRLDPGGAWMRRSAFSPCGEA